MFVFTDSKEVPVGTVRFYQKHQKFPAPTLFRYKWFLKQKEALAKMDYLFYCDVDMRFVNHVGTEILSRLVATLHPGFYNKLRKEFSYEKRQESTAYISPMEGKHYYCGGFNGGSVKEYLEMAKVISANVEKDLKKNIVAEWHDESHLNRYLIDNLPTKILSPSYCYPEELVLPFIPKLLALKKNHNQWRYKGLELFFRETVDRIKNRSFNMVMKKKWNEKLDIITVAFNNSKVIEQQIALLKNNLNDSFFHTIADNSSNQIVCKEIAGICLKHGINYLRIPQSVIKYGPSESHGRAITWVFNNFVKKRSSKYFGFIDHDIFPIKKTSIVPFLDKQLIYGLLQERNEKWYLWAGFCFFNAEKTFKNINNFRPGSGLDTGGGNWNTLYSKINKQNIIFPRHTYKKIVRNKLIPLGKNENSGSLVKKDTLVEFVGDWLHIFNASNWRGNFNKIKYNVDNLIK